MSKRYTETTKWADPWFCSLSERDRLFWVYILDSCDHAGIWRANYMLIEVFFPGYGRDLSRFGSRIIQINDEKWFIPKFIAFQYPGGLKKENRAHLSVIDILKKEGLWPLPLKEEKPLPLSLQQGPSMTHSSIIDGVKDKDKDKDMVKDKDNNIITRARDNSDADGPPPPPPFDCEWCGWVKGGKHKKCHFCFRIYKAGENDDNHRC